MGNYIIFCAWFVVIPSFIAVINKNKIPKRHNFLILAIVSSLFFEILSYYFAVKYKNNLLPGNFSYLFNSVLILCFFNIYDIPFKKGNICFKIILIGLIIFWVVENFIISDLNSFNSAFAVFYSFLFLVYSLMFLNKILIKTSFGLFKLPEFYFAIGLLVLYTFSSFIKLVTANFFGMNPNLFKPIWSILSTAFLVSYTLLSIGMLWIKKK